MNKIKEILLFLIILVIKFISYFRHKDGLIICAPPSGTNNKGDEALILSTLQNLYKKDIRIYVLQTGAALLDFILNDFEVKILNQYFQAFNTFDSFIERLRLIFFMSDKKDIIIIGADLLDNGYGGERSEATLSVAAEAKALGLNVIVNSFSMRSIPSDRLKSMLKMVSKNGESFWVRDPLSLSRLTEAGFMKAKLSADIAFLLKPEPINLQNESILKLISNNNHKLIGININPICLRNFKDGPVAFRNLMYNAMIKLYQQKKYYFILIPSHSPDDVNFMLPIYDEMLKVNNNCCTILRPIPSATHVKTILGSCEHVFTGRLHIAILTIGMKKPVTCFPYQGKFEGQLNHFGIDDCIFDSKYLPDTVDDLVEFVNRRVNVSSIISNKICESFETVRGLALKNFESINK